MLRLPLGYNLVNLLVILLIILLLLVVEAVVHQLGVERKVEAAVRVEFLLVPFPYLLERLTQLQLVVEVLAAQPIMAQMVLLLL
jgi:hypothetical protein